MTVIPGLFLMAALTSQGNGGTPKMWKSDCINGFPGGGGTLLELSLQATFHTVALILQRATFGPSNYITYHATAYKGAAGKTALKSHLVEPIGGFGGGKSTFAILAQDVLV